MNKINKIFLLVLFIFLSNYFNAQSVYQLSIDQLFQLGIENSLKIKKSLLDIQISEEEEKMSKINRLSDINLRAINGYPGNPAIYDKDLSFLKHSYMPDWMQNYSIDLNQPIYQGGRIHKTIKKSTIEKEISYLVLEKDKAELKLYLIDKYLTLYQLYKQKEVFTTNIKEAEQRLHNTIKMKEEGMITNNEVLRNEILLTNYKLSLQETQNDIAIISQQLGIILGLDENLILLPDIALLTSLSPILKLNAENDYLNNAYQNFPELKISKQNTKLAENNLKIVRSKYLPSLQLQAATNLVRPITSVSPALDYYSNTWSITLGISYKISSWFDHKNHISIAKRQIEIQKNLEEQIEQEIQTEIKSAYIKHTEALNRINYLTKSVEQANENYRITKNKYYNQLAILTDLLDAASIQLMTELQLTEAKAKAIYTYYQLKRASGDL